MNIIFTDGSSRGNPGPGGWGAVVLAGENVFELGGREKHTTNNRMELTAAIEALKFVLAIAGEVVIYTDSNYLINGITKWIFAWEKRGWITQNKEPVLNKDLWQQLLEVSQAKKIKWHYVGGHVGIAGNERADEIATLFADCPKTTFGTEKPRLFSGPVSNYKIDISNLESEEKKKTEKSRSKAKAYSYLSMVDGIIETHKTWDECKKRVEGKSGAKYKKALTPTEEKEIIKSWESE